MVALGYDNYNLLCHGSIMKLKRLKIKLPNNATKIYMFQRFDDSLIWWLIIVTVPILCHVVL